MMASVVVVSRTFSAALVKATVIRSRIVLPLPVDVGRVTVEPAAVPIRINWPAVGEQVAPQATGAGPTTGVFTILGAVKAGELRYSLVPRLLPLLRFARRIYRRMRQSVLLLR